MCYAVELKNVLVADCSDFTVKRSVSLRVQSVFFQHGFLSIFVTRLPVDGQSLLNVAFIWRKTLR